jgi:hypothetical protein
VRVTDRHHALRWLVCLLHWYLPFVFPLRGQYLTAPAEASDYLAARLRPSRLGLPPAQDRRGPLAPVLKGDVGGLRVLLAAEVLQLLAQHTPQFEALGYLEPPADA